MSESRTATPRCVALVGPYLSGKTSLMESLLHACGAIHRKGTIKDRTTVGDTTPEARTRQMSIEITAAHGTFMDDPWIFLDCPGSIEFTHEAQSALMERVALGGLFAHPRNDAATEFQRDPR